MKVLDTKEIPHVYISSYDKKIVEDDTEIISIYYGESITEEDAEKLRSRAAEAFPSCDVELQYGGQPIYFYILSAE